MYLGQEEVSTYQKELSTEVLVAWHVYTLKDVAPVNTNPSRSPFGRNALFLSQNKSLQDPTTHSLFLADHFVLLSPV